MSRRLARSRFFILVLAIVFVGCSPNPGIRTAAIYGCDALLDVGRGSDIEVELSGGEITIGRYADCSQDSLFVLVEHSDSAEVSAVPTSTVAFFVEDIARISRLEESSLDNKLATLTAVMMIATVGFFMFLAVSLDSLN